jgi:hypothetical protein
VKLRIGETEYDYQTALNKVSLGVLMDLKSQGGPGRRSISLALDLIDAGLRADTDAGEVEDDERVLLGMAGLIFICKRHAGESLAWADALTYSWSDLTFVPETVDQVDAPDPTAASGEASPPDAETQNAPSLNGKTSGTGTSKTSKKASTAA